MVWATARIAPSSLYLLLLLQPAPKVPYTPRLATARMIIIIGFISYAKLLEGAVNHNNMGTPITMTVIRWNKEAFDNVGELFCLVNSFKASANGTSTPAGPGLLGPFRRWM